MTGMANPALNSHTLSSWLKNDDIDGGLAADFDGSLSGLGVELGTSTYNMSEALLALPVFKQEVMENRHLPELPEVGVETVQHFLKQLSHVREDFQYILGAATSPAQKMFEETLTYLNQGQSYELKLKKLGEPSSWKEKYVMSTIKVTFHERRLQFMEREHIDSWKMTRPGERIVDLDMPLSYGVLDAHVDPVVLNEIQVIWDPTKDTGVYLKVHCISTEFTPKKHGGEKGVPFRLQVETYSHGDGEPHILHAASSQIKVFKPKGADRKQKTDKEKMEKRSDAEKGKYQPSYDCTVLTEIPLDQVANPKGKQSTTAAEPPQTPSSQEPPSPAPSNMSNCSTTICSQGSPENSSDSTGMSSGLAQATANLQEGFEPLSPNANAKQVAAWLQAQRFSQFIKVFQNFSGADILRLTKDDLVQICGLADGIRLNNALTSRAVRPRLTLYVCQDTQDVFHALYLENLTCEDLVQRIAHLFSLSVQQISELYVMGPEHIHIHVTNEVVQNLRDESRFVIEALTDQASPEPNYKIILKAFS